MSKKQNFLTLAIKGVLFLYLPVIMLLYIIYEVIFKIDMIFPWYIIIIYAVMVGILTARNYAQKTIEQDVEDFSSVKSSIIKGRWKIIEQNENRLIVKPTFDFPQRLLIDDKVQIDYSDKKAIIIGPWYYANNIVKDINGRSSSIWKKRIASIVAFVLIIAMLSIPVLKELGFFSELQKNRHNSFVKNVPVIEIESKEIVGNSIENTNNYGYGVENEEYVFYVENHLNLIRANKDYQDKTYLIQKSGGTGINRLNIVGDWIFYSSGETFNRIRIDGTDNQIIYKLGYLLDIHIKDKWVYFINLSDNFNVYRMDINGRNLERFLKIRASDIALYDDKMIFSHQNDDKSYVESIGLDGSERNVELEVVANDLIKLDGYYYFIGDGYRLYKSQADGITAPQLLVDDKVSSYIITDNGIFYSLHSEDVGYPGQDIYKIDLEGNENALIIDTKEVEGFTKMGDWILFHSSDSDLKPEFIIKRLNIFTNDIEIIK